MWIRICYKVRFNMVFFWFFIDRWNNSIIGLGKGFFKLFFLLSIYSRDSKNIKRRYLGRKCFYKSKVFYCLLFLLKSGKED